MSKATWKALVVEEALTRPTPSGLEEVGGLGPTERLKEAETRPKLVVARSMLAVIQSKPVETEEMESPRRYSAFSQ